MSPKIKLALYAISVFCVYALLTWILRLVAHKMPEGASILGVYTETDIWLGLAIATILTYSHYMKSRRK